MDPNEALSRIRQCIQRWRTGEDNDEQVEAMADALFAFEDLDGWLSRGGFLPSAWQGGARFDYSSSASRQHYIDTGEYIDPLGHPNPAHGHLPERDDDYTAEAINRTTDHDARPDDDPEPGDRCKDCGQPVTWTGPSHLDWQHV